MKKLLLILLTSISFAQAPTIEWERNFGGTDNENARSVIATSDGNYLVGGYTESNNGDVSGLHGFSIEDFWILKITPSGSVIWKKTFGGDGDEEIYSMIETADGGFAIAGYATYPNNGDVFGVHSNDWREDFWIIRLDSAGTLIWAKALGGSLNEVAKDIKQTADGGFIVIGSTMSSDFDVTNTHGVYPDAWVVKLSSAGVIEWQKTYGGTSYDYGSSIILATDGGYIFTGEARSTDGDLTGIPTISNGTMWVVKIDSGGSIQWQKKIAGGGLGASIINSEGGYLIYGAASPSGAFTGSGQTGVVKLDTSGNILWAKSYGGNSGGTWYGNIIQSSDNNYVFIARITSAGGDVTSYNGGGDIWVVKISKQNGAILWQKTLGRADADENLGSICQTANEEYVICGYVVSVNGFPGYQGGGSDYYVAKLSPDSLSVENFDTDYFMLYPNPAFDVISIQSSENLTVNQCVITDITGKIVNIKTENPTQINIENLSSGMYFIQIYSGQNKYTSKFIKQ